MKRRQFVGLAAAVPFSNIIFNPHAFAEQDMPKPSRNRFLLYIHMDSSCGVGSGLVQPLKAGQWPSGFHRAGQGGGAVNPLLNKQVEASNGQVLHDYLKFLAPMAGDMCLVNGTAQSLDHNVARIYQKRGVANNAAAPEWSMAVAEFMKTDSRRNPMVVTPGVKTASVPDITPVMAKDIGDFSRITRDLDIIPQDNASPFVSLLKKRFVKPNLLSVRSDAQLQGLAEYQLTTLANGLKELNDAQADIKMLEALLSRDAVKTQVKDCADANGISSKYSDEVKNQLVLAGILAKTGLGNGFHIHTGGEDHHQGGGDVYTPRNMGAVWAMISIFWKWVRSVNLQDDVMIVISHDFSRTAYNGKIIEVDCPDDSGKNQRLKCEGRDHALAMGMMFINANVPKGGRIGYISDNLVPMATKDANGTIDPSGNAYTSDNMVGTMLRRVYPELFPTERMVRKHWPAYKEIAPILA